MTESLVKPKKQVGTKTSEQIIGTAASKLSAASKSALDAFKQVEKLEEACEKATLKLTDTEQKIAALEVEYDQKLDQQKFKLDMEYKTNQASFANKYLSDNQLTAIKTGDLQTLQASLTTLKSEFDQKLNAEVGKAKGMMERDYQSKIDLKVAEFNTTQAQNAAQIESLKSQLAASITNADQWRKALEEEREAGVKRAQASSIGAVNLTSPGK